MGLWNFVKNAGKSLGIGAAEAATPEDASGAGALKREIEELGLDAGGLEVKVEGDTVTLSGKARSQEEKEKAILAVGNVEGVATVHETIDTPDAPREPVFHTVVKGDNLWKIAQKHLGDGARYPEIFEANKPMLSDPDKIYPGQSLRIPAA